MRLLLPRYIVAFNLFSNGEGFSFTIKFGSDTSRRAGESPVSKHLLPHRKDARCSSDREFFSFSFIPDMLHREEKFCPPSEDRISVILTDFFNNFESTEIAENLLFIASDFVENPPNGISQNRANYWLFEMQSLAVLLPKLRIAMLESFTDQTPDHEANTSY